MSRETISAERMILTRRESDMSTVEERKASLTSTMTPHPHIFMRILNKGSGDRNRLTEWNQWKEWKEDKYQNPRAIRRVLIWDDTTPNLKHCKPFFLAGARWGIIILAMNPFSPQRVKGSMVGRFTSLPMGSISGGNINEIAWPMTNRLE